MTFYDLIFFGLLVIVLGFWGFLPDRSPAANRQSLLSFFVAITGSADGAHPFWLSRVFHLDTIDGLDRHDRGVPGHCSSGLRYLGHALHPTASCTSKRRRAISTGAWAPLIR